MPFATRVTALVVAFAVAAAVVAGGCGGHREAGSFCAQITSGHAAFDSIDVARSSRALALFDRVAATAPATIAPDLKTVSSVVSLLYHNPKALLKEPANFKRFVEARDRVDEYLRQSCGVRIPRSQSG